MHAVTKHEILVISLTVFFDATSRRRNDVTAASDTQSVW